MDWFLSVTTQLTEGLCRGVGDGQCAGDGQVNQTMAQTQRQQAENNLNRKTGIMWTNDNSI